MAPTKPSAIIAYLVGSGIASFLKMEPTVQRLPKPARRQVDGSLLHQALVKQARPLINRIADLLRHRMAHNQQPILSPTINFATLIGWGCNLGLHHMAKTSSDEEDTRRRGNHAQTKVENMHQLASELNLGKNGLIRYATREDLLVMARSKQWLINAWKHINFKGVYDFSENTLLNLINLDLASLSKI